MHAHGQYRSTMFQNVYCITYKIYTRQNQQQVFIPIHFTNIRVVFIRYHRLIRMVPVMYSSRTLLKTVVLCQTVARLLYFVKVVKQIYHFADSNLSLFGNFHSVDLASNVCVTFFHLERNNKYSISLFG